MDNSPLPEIPPLPSNGNPCLNCGKDLGNATTFCPHCGAAVPTEAAPTSAGVKILGIIGLTIGALFLGAAGACFVLLGGTSLVGLQSDIITAITNAAIAGVLLIGAGLCIKKAIAIAKKR